MNKLALLLTAISLGAVTAAAQEVQIVNREEADQIFGADPDVKKIVGDQQFVEGPVWINAGGGYLVYSDIPANQLKRWDPVNGVQTYRQPSQQANGNTLDRTGRLVTAHHDGLITRTELDGAITTIAERYNGAHLSSPNDVVVMSDGTIWFTDPDYGLGDRAKETPGNWVYRYNPADGSLNAVVTDTDRPNGLCFAPDEKLLYVADSGAPRHIRVFTVGLNGFLSGGRVFAELDNGAPDGIRCDEDGRVWSSSGDGVQVFNKQGELIARVLLPEAGANLAFGGPDGKTVYVTARTSLYSFNTIVRAAGWPE